MKDPKSNITDGHNQEILRLQKRIAVLEDAETRQRAPKKPQKEQKMLRRLLESQHHEMQLVAYEIHDGVAQLLTSTVSQLQMFDHFRDAKPEEAQKIYQTARQILDQAIDETRRLIQGLRHPVLEESGVATAIRMLIAEHEERSDMDIEFVCEIQFGRLDSRLENALYRIAQEGLNNASGHSGTKKVRLTLQQEGRQITLDIRDWGHGFDTAAVDAESFGLEGIRQRAKILGGQASIQSTPGQGTRITVQLPLASEENLAADE